MIDVPVSAVMTEAAPTVPPDATTVEVAHHLRQPDVHAVVVDDGDAIVGVVTESDVVAVVAEGGGNPAVTSFMSSPVETVAPTTPVGLAADRMRDAGVTRLPVVDGAERRSSGSRPGGVDSEGSKIHRADGDAADSAEHDSTNSRTESGDDSRHLGLVTRADVAPYLSRHRLDVDWEGDPLSLDGTGTPDPATE